jgi:cell division protein FtsN
MNGMPMDAPRSLIRKSSERNPMIDLEAADEAAELERTRKAQLEEKERSRAEHHHQAESAAPAPVKAKPAKRKKT